MLLAPARHEQFQFHLKVLSHLLAARTFTLVVTQAPPILQSLQALRSSVSLAPPSGGAMVAPGRPIFVLNVKTLVVARTVTAEPAQTGFAWKSVWTRLPPPLGTGSRKLKNVKEL